MLKRAIAHWNIDSFENIRRLYSGHICLIDVDATSMWRFYVTSISIRRQFDVVCMLDSLSNVLATGFVCTLTSLVGVQNVTSLIMRNNDGLEYM